MQVHRGHDIVPLYLRGLIPHYTTIELIIIGVVCFLRVPYIDYNVTALDRVSLSEIES